MAPSGTFSDLRRMQKVVRVMVRYGFGALLRSSGLPGLADVLSGDVDRELSKKPAEARLRLMLQELGPTFIKFGQVLSTRPDLLPPRFIRELSKLQESADPLPWPEVKKVLVESLGIEPESAFAEIDQQPLATASIAQVHRGRLQNGTQVVVKVRRPGIEPVLHADMSILRGIARLLESTIQEMGNYDPAGWVDEFDRALRMEMDLSNELRNLTEFMRTAGKRPQIKIPRPYPELSSPMVLVMEYLEGRRVTEIEDQKKRTEAAEIIIREAFEQVFVDGLFHADPHPGNLRELEEGGYAILDFGLIGRLSSRMRTLVVEFVMALALKDAENIARLAYRAGISSERVDLAKLRDDCQKLIDEHWGKNLHQLDSEYIASQLMGLIAEHGIALPRDLALLGKAGITIEGVVRTLDPNLDVFALAMPYANRLIEMQLEPGDIGQSLTKALMRISGMMRDVPLQMDQIMIDLQNGRMVVNVKHPSLDELSSSIRELGISFMLGMFGAAGLLGAFLILAPFGYTIYGVPVVSLIGIALAFVCSSMVFSWALLRGRSFKIRLSSLLGFLRWFRGK